MNAMNRPLVAGLAGCIILVASCKRSDESPGSVESGKRSVRERIPSSPAEQMAELRAGSQRPRPPDHNSSRAVKIMAEIFRTNDQASLKELERLFKEQPGVLTEGTGAGFMALLKPDEWERGLEFVGGIEDDTVRLSIQVDMMGRAMTVDSDAALEILAKFKPVAAKGLVINSMSFDFERMVWQSTGRQTGKDWDKRPIDRKFLSSLAENPKGIENYTYGLQSSTQEAIYAGEFVDIRKRMEGLPTAQQSSMATSFALSNLGRSAGNAVLVGQLIDIFAESHQSAATYGSLGSGLSRDVFQQIALSPSTPLDGDALDSFVMGWVSARPKSSVEWIISKTNNPEILKPAFSRWAASDSMEASKWLQTQSAGPVKDACTEQLCDYLLEKSSTEKAKGYLETLPADARERLAAKYPSP